VKCIENSIQLPETLISFLLFFLPFFFFLSGVPLLVTGVDFFFFNYSFKSHTRFLKGFTVCSGLCTEPIEIQPKSLIKQNSYFPDSYLNCLGEGDKPQFNFKHRV